MGFAGRGSMREQIAGPDLRHHPRSCSLTSLFRSAIFLPMTDSNSRLVYSTEKPIPRKETPAVRAPATPIDPAACRVVVRLDRKGRGGKAVTVVEGLQLPAEESEKLLKRWKARFGAGGAVKGNALEIQGDRCDAVMAELVKMGYKPKRSGG